MRRQASAGKRLRWAASVSGGHQSDDDRDHDELARDHERIMRTSRGRTTLFVDTFVVEVVLWAVLGVLFALGFSFYMSGYVAVSLTVMPSAEALSAQLGDWRVEWRNGTQLDKPQLRVTWAFAPPDAEPAWTSPPGAAFVAAIADTWTATESHGHISVLAKRSGMCREQVIDTVTVQGDRFLMRGWLTACPAAITPPLFELWLSLPTGAAEAETGRQSTPMASTLSMHLALCTGASGGSGGGGGGGGEFGEGGTCESPPLGAFQVVLIGAANIQERIYGMGAQFATVNLKGSLVPVLTNEQGIGRGVMPLWLLTWLRFGSTAVAGSKHSTYTAMPTYVTSRGRGLYLNNTEYTQFDFLSPVVTMVEHNASSMHANIVAGRGHTPVLAMLEALTARAGRFARLPEWAAAGGAVVGMQGGSAVVRAKVARLRAKGVPTIAVWLQDWVGKREIGETSRLWWNWEVDRVAYPDWEEMVAELAAQDIRVMAYVNPHLTDVTDKPGHRRNLFREARDRGFLVRRCDGSEAQLGSFGLNAGMVDLSNPEAYAWMKEVVRGMLRAGVSGWMADFGEALPMDACMHDGTTGGTWHNKYPAVWAALNQEVIAEAVRAPHDAVEAEAARDAWIFTRAAALGSLPHLNMQWLGDQLTSWDAHDGLASVLPGSLSSGFSGLSLVHSDIGGYTSAVHNGMALHRRTSELFARWCELAAFTPVYRSHEGVQPSVNVQFDTDTNSMAAFRKFAVVHAALATYRSRLLEEAYATGAPVMRHMLMHYPHDAMASVVTSQFMFGPELLVAPVVQRGAASVSVYLPLGSWVRLRLGKDFEDRKTGVVVSSGMRYRVSAPLGHPAVFYRTGSEVAAQLQAQLDAVLDPPDTTTCPTCEICAQPFGRPIVVDR